MKHMIGSGESLSAKAVWDHMARSLYLGGTYLLQMSQKVWADMTQGPIH